jgi:spore germination protein KA
MDNKKNSSSLKKYTRYAKKISRKKNIELTDSNTEKELNSLSSLEQEGRVFSTVDQNFYFLNSVLGKDTGLIKCKYKIFEGKVPAGIAYIASITDEKFISSQVIEPLLKGQLHSVVELYDILTLIQSEYIYIPNMKEAVFRNHVMESLLNGDTVLFIDGIHTALIIGSRKIERRAIEAPANEVTVSASLESFTEDLETNCSMIIKRLPTPDLNFESYTVGKFSKTKIKLIWLKDTINFKAVEEAKRRIQEINVDAVGDIGVLSELITDKPISLFPKYMQTQRPDVVSRHLIVGHFAIVCDHSPHAIIAPIAFWDHFKTMDDYAEKPIISSFLRMVRLLAFALAVLISPLYLAFVTHNHSIVPPDLAINISSGREGVPFPSIVELLIMTFTVSIIREASLRIQGAVGFFGATLAAVIIGQSAVDAGYISPSLIIVTAATTIASFAMSSPKIVHPLILLNYLLIILSSMFGMFGLINGIAVIIWHMVSLESFGIPYLYPLVPFDLEGMKDIFIRAPYKTLKRPPYNRP